MPAAQYFACQSCWWETTDNPCILPRKSVNGDPSFNAKECQQCVTDVMLPRNIGRAISQPPSVAATIPNARLWHWRTSHRRHRSYLSILKTTLSKHFAAPARAFVIYTKVDHCFLFSETLG